MSGRIEIPNLDAMSADELDAWRTETDSHRTYRMRVAQEYARRKAMDHANHPEIPLPQHTFDDISTRTQRARDLYDRTRGGA